MFDPESRKHNKTWKCYYIDLTKNVVFSKVDIALHSVTLKFRQWNLITWMTGKYPFHIVRKVLFNDMAFVWTCNRCVQDASSCQLQMKFSWIQTRFEIMFHTMYTPVKHFTITKRRFCKSYLHTTRVIVNNSFIIYSSWQFKYRNDKSWWVNGLCLRENHTFLYPYLL